MATITIISGLILLSMHCYYVLIEDESIKNKILEHWLYGIICFVLMAVGIVCIILETMLILSYGIILGSIFLILILFFDSVPEEYDSWRIHPWSFLIIFVILPIFEYLLVFLIRHTRFIAFNTTTKQLKSIEEFRKMVSKSNIKLSVDSPGYKYLEDQPMKLSQMLWNFYDFFFMREIPASQITLS